MRKDDVLLNLDADLCVRYRHSIHLVGKRWTGLMLLLLMAGPKRFSELSRELRDAGDRMVTKRLRELEGEEILVREVIPESPVRVEYRLTDKGHDLAKVIEALCLWSDRWVEEPEESDASTRHMTEIRVTECHFM